MKANRFVEAKKALSVKLGNAYPTCREEMNLEFVAKFGAYVPGVDENDFEEYADYEDAKYSSERWAYFCILSDVSVISQYNEEVGSVIRASYIDWVVENYFPEFAYDTTAKSLCDVLEGASCSNETLSALAKDLQNMALIVAKIHSIEET